MEIHQNPSREGTKQLLADNDLPADLEGLDLNHFSGCLEAGVLRGVVGSELYGENALLRSLVVVEAARGLGVGNALVTAQEQHLSNVGVKSVYLLTETAESYFEGLGYVTISRDQVPESIRNTAQFSNLCRESANLMFKAL